MSSKHLGGHRNITHLDEGVLSYLKKKYDIKTMVDVGCGPGGMEEIAQKLNINWKGIDGDENIKNYSIVICDFEKDTLDIDNVDLIWSIEFLEHVWEKYMDNYMNIFKKGKYVFCTAAPPGKPGHHHVNCQTINYWIKKFDEYGFTYINEENNECKKMSTMRREFVKECSMFFINRNLN